MNIRFIRLINVIKQREWKISTLVLLGLSVGVLAGGPDHMAMPNESFMTTESPWSLIVGLGYTNFSNMYSSTGQTAIGRLGINGSVFANDDWVIGMEMGVQNGNSMILSTSQATINALGGLPIQNTAKSMLDLLVTVKKFFSQSPFFVQLKGGVAYRQWQFDNNSRIDTANTINDLSQLAGEVQAGLGYQITPRTSLDISYQGIFGDNPNLTANASTGIGHVSHIPMQNGALLDLSMTL